MKFSELAVGTKFKIAENEFVKIEPEKVSCCRTNNALKSADSSKTMIKPDTDVELVNEENNS